MLAARGADGACRSASTSCSPRSASRMPAMMVLAEWRWRRTRRRRVPRARQALGQGHGDPVRGRRRVGHGAVVRARPALAALHAVRRADHRHAVLARGLRVLHRGDLPRHLSVRLGAHVAERRTSLLGNRRGAERRGVGGVRRDGERVDEHARRRHGRRTAGSPRSIRSRRCSTRRRCSRALHMVLAAYAATGLAVAGIHASLLLRGSTQRVSSCGARDRADGRRARRDAAAALRRLERADRRAVRSRSSSRRSRGSSTPSAGRRCASAAGPTRRARRRASRSRFRAGCRCSRSTIRRPR